MTDLLKFFGAPGSIPFLVVSVLIGLALVRVTRRFRRAGIVWLFAVTLGYIVLALPVVANAIAGGLPAADRRDGEIRTLIVLDGDNRRGRVREAQRLLRAAGPVTVWVLGGRWILDALEEAGVSGPEFRYDATAGTTSQQMGQVGRIASDASARPTAVIASRLQAPRVQALARARAIPVMVLPSAVDREPPVAGLWAFVPTYVALRVSRDAIYEHGALAYYQWRGWIR